MQIKKMDNLYNFYTLIREKFAREFKKFEDLNHNNFKILDRDAKSLDGQLKEVSFEFLKHTLKCNIMLLDKFIDYAQKFDNELADSTLMLQNIYTIGQYLTAVNNKANESSVQYIINHLLIKGYLFKVMQLTELLQIVTADGDNIAAKTYNLQFGSQYYGNTFLKQSLQNIEVWDIFCASQKFAGCIIPKDDIDICAQHRQFMLSENEMEDTVHTNLMLSLDKITKQLKAKTALENYNTFVSNTIEQLTHDTQDELEKKLIVYQMERSKQCNYKYTDDQFTESTCKVNCYENKMLTIKDVIESFIPSDYSSESVCDLLNIDCDRELCTNIID